MKEGSCIDQLYVLRKTVEQQEWNSSPFNVTDLKRLLIVHTNLCGTCSLNMGFHIEY